MCYVLLLPCHHPPHLRCTIDRSVHCSRGSPCRLSIFASNHLTRCRSYRCHADVAPWWAKCPPPAFTDCIPEEDNCSDGESEGADHACLPPEVFALTWHADVGHIMHMASCIAYIIHLICHQLSRFALCECHMFGFYIILPPFLNICLFRYFNK